MSRALSSMPLALLVLAAVASGDGLGRRGGASTIRAVGSGGVSAKALRRWLDEGGFTSEQLKRLRTIAKEEGAETSMKELGSDAAVEEEVVFASRRSMRPPKAYDSRKDQVALTASTMATTQLGEQAYARVQQALQKSTSPKAASMAGFAAALTQGPDTGGMPKTSTQPAVSSSSEGGMGKAHHTKTEEKAKVVTSHKQLDVTLEMDTESLMQVEETVTARTHAAARYSSSSEEGKGKAHHTKTPITQRDLDPGAPARCENTPINITVSDGTKNPTYKLLNGTKKCPIGEFQKYRHKREPTTYAASCPDGIGWQGFYFDHHQEGGVCLQWTWSAATSGKLQCEKYTCINPENGSNSSTKPKGETGSKRYIRYCQKPGITPFKGVCDKTYCDERPDARQVCQKMQVLHVNQMSRSAGVLMVKRTSCGADGKCAVLKTGLCIDLRENVWSSSFNSALNFLSIADAEGGMIRQAKQFGKLATALLKKHNNRLPTRYACSDTRHRWKYQKKTTTTTTRRRRGGWSCWEGCKKHQDATLARFAILNF